MAAGDKPELKIAIKQAGAQGAQRVSLFSFWRNDNGKLAGKLDGRVKGIRVVMEDGTKHDLYRVDGRHTHFIDCFEERPAPAAAAQESFADEGGGDFGDDGDDLPFMRLDERMH